jgi:thioredoxin reductase (NADPH)
VLQAVVIRHGGDSDGDGDGGGRLETVTAQAAFVAIGRSPALPQVLLRGGGELRTGDSGYVPMRGRTQAVAGVPGLFACGDVADDRYHQAVTAAGAGAAAAIDASRWLEGGGGGGGGGGGEGARGGGS